MEQILVQKYVSKMFKKVTALKLETELVKFGLIYMLFGLFSQVFGVKESIFGVKKSKNKSSYI